MDILKSLLCITIIAIIRVSVSMFTVKERTTRRYLLQCTKLGPDPKFKNDILFGEPWRVYYTWDMTFQNRCVDLTFKNVTPMIVNRVHKHMYRYLDRQPRWESATMLVKMLRTLNEMLFFSVYNMPNAFFAVPDTVVAQSRHTTVKNLLLYHLRIFRKNKYLLMMDCRRGVTSLMARKANKDGAATFAATLAIPGLGSPACVDVSYENETYYKAL